MSERRRIATPPVAVAAFLAAVALLPPGPAAAQTPFALQNVGQRVVPDDARMVARGFGMTEHDSLHPGFKNVASLSSLRHVAIKFTGYGESADHEDATGSRHTYRTYAPDLRVGLPVLKGRLGLTAGFTIFRSSQYQTRVDTTWQALEDSIIGNHQFVREGSLFTVPLGVAWQPVDGVSLGASLNLVRGAIRDAAGDFFELPAIGGNPFYQPNSVVVEDRFSGTSTTFAALLEPVRRVRLALAYTPAYDVDATREEDLQGVAARGRSTWVLAMPAEYRAGFQVPLFGRWKVGGDGFWAETSTTGGRADWEATATDESAWSVGLERVGARERHGGVDNLPLRLGVSSRRWAYTVGGAPVDERTWSVGTGFPFRSDMGQLDLAVSYGRIGDLETNGRESSVWRLTFSVTGLEAWW
ncbi:MAG: hypothetical protein ABR506_01985 [Candidatus Krumholzibacteriia bacterium]